MKVSTYIKRIAGTLTLASLILSPVVLKAQDQSQASLSLQNVKDQLKQNKNYLDQASKQGKAGDAAGLQTALENYDRGMEGINTALSHDGGFSGSESQRTDALSRVKDATSKHTKVLQGLLTKVPPQAQAAIQNAISVSQKGHDTATASLQSNPGQQGSQGQGGQPSGVGQGTMGRPSGVGAPSGMPGGTHGGMPGGGRSSGRP
jgi:hypothetical protein